ncbi:sodium transporter [Vespertiliibacter pulmonis]|uniref:BASS family bile acid:Na+ symporter n=1 Tax=Vespertiliibacter pulmonis TaxID=1443036 RepID=A0A3N4WMY1_9PAST|nr:bile acid:sodium symporter family protein [Vespertiliibacter pulmonis]QLB20454.1 sodium transporter [Vespertiliibacter pulmonis]RPE86444.1 BASS family bile acid:Na+ symporter [Vespertiliibacter pulmonis]
MSLFIKLSQFISKTFAIWVIMFAIIATQFPDIFKLIVPWIPYLLGIVMLGMGLTLTFKDFTEITRNPKGVIIGVIAQFVIMPMIAFFLAKIFQLPADLAIGVILVGACPGGTSSNVITFLARGNTALSVACTTISTLLAPILTPAVFYLFASQWLDINASSMFISVLKIVLLPIFVGLLIRSIFKQKIENFSQIMPLISVIAIILILCAVVAVSKDKIIESGLLIFGIVALHNILGYLLGYGISRAFRLSSPDSRAISIEVGMQNSGLGAALAALHFKFNPIIAVPSAVFSLWHNISGPILAMIFTLSDNKK